MSEHHEHQHHHEGNHDQHHHVDPNSASDWSAQPTAPFANDNGFVVVPPTPQSSVESSEATSNTSDAIEKVVDLLTNEHQAQDIQRVLSELGSNLENKLSETHSETIKAEADSSSSLAHEQQPASSSSSNNKPNKKDESATSYKKGQHCDSNASFLCPYYMFGMRIFFCFVKRTSFS